MRIRAWLFIALALALAQTSFGDISTASNGSISSCANLSSSPTTIAGTLYTQFDCSLYNDASSYSIDLTPLMEQGGASLSDNIVGAGYIVVINGDPSTLSDSDLGLYNQSLWDTVLFWPGDQAGGYGSDSLTVYWPGAFPTVSTVRTFDQNINDYYGDPFQDSDFFVQSTGAETVYAPYTDEYDIISTPEPGAMLLLGSCLAMLGGVVLKRRGGARRAAFLK
jgi:hypothetical protein